MVGRPLSKKVRRLSTDSEGDDDSYHVPVPPMKAHSRHGTKIMFKKLIMDSNDALAGTQVLGAKRNRSIKKSYVLESESEVDSEIPDLGNDDDEDEDADAEADMDVDNIQLPPSKQTRIAGKQPGGTKSMIRGLTSAPQKHKYVENVSDDDEMSGLESDPGEEEEEATGIRHRGEREENELLADEDDEDIDSDDEPGGGGQNSAPDLNKLTRRQRARFEEGVSGHLMALPDEVQVKKHLTAEEHAMRRAEMARRRKNLSEKRNEEEKLETINKLLKKQAPKTSNRRRELNIATGGDGTPDVTETPKANPMFVRWVSNKDGNRIGVPEEWIEGPVGAIFRTVT